MGLTQERTVPSDFILLELDFRLALVVEVDGVFRVLQQIVVALDPVGYIGVDESVVLKIRVQFLGVMVPQELEELEQVDDLVVAPVADVGPRVVRLDGLPLEAVLEHAVRIVPVEGGGVEELEDHPLDELGVGVHQGLPVLEDVAPVALVVEDLGAVLLVAEVDGEPVPRAAWVTVAAAEFQRQVLGAQPLEVEVLGLGGLLLEEEEVELLGPAGHGLLLLEEHLVVGPVDVGHEVGPLDGVVLVEDAAAHDVEHRVGEVPDVAAAVGRELQAIARGHQRDEALGTLLDVGEDRFAQLVWGLKVFLQLDDPADGLSQIGDHHPILAFAGGEVEFALDEVGAAFGLDVGLRLDGATGPEGVELLGAQQHGGGVEADGPHHIGLEALTRFGLVGDDGAERIEAEGTAFQFAFLVGVDEVAAAPLQSFGNAVGEQVLDAVEHVHLQRGGGGGFEPGLAHEAEALAGRPLVAEGQAEVVVGLFEDDLVAVGVLVKVPLDAVDAAVLVGERLPEDAPVRGLDQHDGLASGGFCALRDLVVGVVGEERVVAVDPSGGQTAIARQEHPVVRMAHDAHEERAHPVYGADLVVGLPVSGHLLSGGGGVGGVEGLLAQIYRCTGSRIAHVQVLIMVRPVVRSGSLPAANKVLVPCVTAPRKYSGSAWEPGEGNECH